MGLTSRRKFVGLSLLSAGALSIGLAGCGANSAAGSSHHTRDHVTDITYWSGHSSGALYKAVRTEVRQFNKTHPSIHVTFKAIGASHHGLAAFESGQAPNVGMVSGYVVPHLAESGALVNLKSYIHGPQGLSTKQIKQWFYPVIWQDTKETNGTQYVMPLEKKSLLVIYYNESLFQKAGISTPPTTWAQVGQDAAKITKLGPSYHGIAWTPELQQYFDMITANGGHVFTQSRNRRSYNINTPPAAATLSMMRRWIADGRMITTSGYQYQLDFGTGKVGMVIDASAGYTYDKSSVGGKFTMGGIPAPKGTSGHTSQYINGTSTVMFNVGTPAQKSASWTFMKWMASPTTNVYWDEHTNYLPLGPDGYKLMQPFYHAHPAQAASYSNPAQWWFKPRTANFEPSITAMNAAFTQALAGKISVSQALHQMTQVGTNYLSGKVRG